MSPWELEILARERRRDLEREAGRERLWRTTRIAQPRRIGGWRQVLGTILVRLGCWLVDGDCALKPRVAASQSLADPAGSILGSTRLIR